MALCIRYLVSCLTLNLCQFVPKSALLSHLYGYSRYSQLSKLVFKAFRKACVETKHGNRLAIISLSSKSFGSWPIGTRAMQQIRERWLPCGLMLRLAA
ncbi:hypothetical protein DER44DRAFT_764647 [Fusarium oxysporum]|nr:hypothetical protein DER44DRAFT_764647 [Fusarium oxysporum]